MKRELKRKLLMKNHFFSLSSSCIYMLLASSSMIECVYDVVYVVITRFSWKRSREACNQYVNNITDDKKGGKGEREEIKSGSRTSLSLSTTIPASDARG